MAATRPVGTRISIVARNYDETLQFYRLLGIDIGDPVGEPTGTLRAEVKSPEGCGLSIENEALARIFNSGKRETPDDNPIVLTALVTSRDAVDSTYRKIVSAGYRGRQAPYDALWGARFAIVLDPEGNDVGIMSPVDPAFRSWPARDSPAAS